MDKIKIMEREIKIMEGELEKREEHLLKLLRVGSTNMALIDILKTNIDLRKSLLTLKREYLKLAKLLN